MNITYLIPQDKLLHLGAGFLAAAAAFFAQLLLPPLVAFLPPFVAQAALGYAVAASALAGAGKEAFDWASNAYRAAQGLPPTHDVDVLDFLATVAGGLAWAATISIVIVAGWTP